MRENFSISHFIGKYLFDKDRPVEMAAPTRPIIGTSRVFSAILAAQTTADTMIWR